MDLYISDKKLLYFHIFVAAQLHRLGNSSHLSNVINFFENAWFSNFFGDTFVEPEHNARNISDDT